MDKKYVVVLSKFAAKQVGRLPDYIQAQFIQWLNLVELMGLPKVRTRSGYHDEPLKGDRTGQRSARLSRSYRVIYTESNDLEICVAGILEVNKHDY